MENTDQQIPVVVTGATGFLGAVLCRKLVHAGYRVRAVYRRAEKLDQLANLDVETVQADVTDSDAIATAIEGAHIVFHIAALFRQHGVPDSTFWSVNVNGTENTLKASADAGVKRFIHCSTVGVHSHIERPPADESEEYRPGDIYQSTKCEGEKLALDWFREGRIDGCVIRPAMIWGPGDNRTLKLFRGIARRRLPVIGDGQTELHWVLVDDVANGMILAAESEKSSGQVYILAGERPINIGELFQRIADCIGVEPIGYRVPAWPIQIAGEVIERLCRPFGIEPPLYRRRVDFFTKTRAFDLSKARNGLSYQPGQDLNSEIERIVESYRSQNLL